MSGRSTLMPNFSIACVATSGDISPLRESADSAATATLSLSTSKKRRRASLVSERPNPSVPSTSVGPTNGTAH
eukprot:2600658-Pyramimonas_sp.AAC.1